MFLHLLFKFKGTEIPSRLRLVYTQVLDPRKRFLGLGADGGHRLRSLEPPPPSWLPGSPPQVLLLSLSSLLSVTLQVPGGLICSEFLSPSPVGVSAPEVSLVPSIVRGSPPTPGPRAHLRPDRSVSASPAPVRGSERSVLERRRGPGRGAGPRGGVGRLPRQALPGSAGGRRGRRSAPLREREGAARRRRLRWRRPRRAGRGRGARRSESARGRRRLGGRDWAEGAARSARSAAGPAARAMAKAGRAGEGGRREGRAASGEGLARLEVGAAGPGEPRRRWAEVLGGPRSGRRRGRPLGAWRGGSARPASFSCAPVTSWDTASPRHRPSGRARSAAPLPGPAEGNVATLPRPWAGGRGERRRGPAAAALSHAPAPTPAPTRTRPLVCRSRYPGRDEAQLPPPPPAQSRAQISSGEGGVLRSTPACEPSAPLPLPDPGKQSLGARSLKGGVLFCGPQGSALPQTQAVWSGCEGGR